MHAHRLFLSLLALAIAAVPLRAQDETVQPRPGAIPRGEVVDPAGVSRSTAVHGRDIHFTALSRTSVPPPPGWSPRTLVGEVVVGSPSFSGLPAGRYVVFVDFDQPLTPAHFRSTSGTWVRRNLVPLPAGGTPPSDEHFAGECLCMYAVDPKTGSWFILVNAHCPEHGILYSD